MDHNQPTSFALLIVVGLEEGKKHCGVNVSWSDHLSLARQGSNLEIQQSFTGHETDFMSKSTAITKLQALFRSGGVKLQLLF
jgi:hypothetical protein